MDHITLLLPQEERIERLRLAAKRKGGNAGLGRALGYTDGAYIGQMLRGERPISEHVMESVAAIHDLRDIFTAHLAVIAQDAKASGIASAVPSPSGVAHLTTLDAPTVPPLTWEELTMPLSTVFRVVLPDDALAPELRAGDWIEVSTEVTAAPGDWVLVRDASGLFYAREFRQRRPGDWTAASSHAGFEPMDAATYGLTVVGTVTAWGSSRRRSAR